MTAGSVVVEVKAEFGRVAVLKRILPEEIRHKYRLVPEMRSVQLAVSVLLQHVEVGRVELIPVVGKVAEQPGPKVDVGEDESAEVADERLNPGPYRRCVKVGAFSLPAARPPQKRKEPGRVSQPDFSKRI